MLKKTLQLISIFLPLVLHGAAITDLQPPCSLEGKKSLLNRPEGIAYAPSGDYIAIANSNSNNVLFYRLAHGTVEEGATAPVFVIDAAGYPHDVAFSPDGEHFAIACRHTNLVHVHRYDPVSGFYEKNPFAVLEGEASSLGGINAVKYHPRQSVLAVCDVVKHQMAFYKFDGDIYEPQAYQVLSGPVEIVNRPDGMAFSSDGKLLAVASHGVHTVLLYEENEDGSYTEEPVEIIAGEETLLTFPHSLSFHPIDDTLAVSSAGGRNTLSFFVKQSDVPPRYPTTPSQTFQIFNPDTIHLQKKYREEGGVKGVSFSPDGRSIGLCSSDIANPTRTVLFYLVE